MNKYFRLTLVIIVCTYFWYCTKTYTEWHFIDSVDLIFHEAGHFLFSSFGMFIGVAAGSGFQIALPVFLSIYFFFTGQKISGALCLLWVGQNLLNVSVYAGDAITMRLDLLGGDGVIHDWNYLLSSLGVLRFTPVIASTIYRMGFMIISIGTILSLFLSWGTDSETVTE